MVEECNGGFLAESGTGTFSTGLELSRLSFWPLESVRPEFTLVLFLNAPKLTDYFLILLLC